MTSKPASRNARATTLAPRSCPSSPGLATRMRTFAALIGGDAISPTLACVVDGARGRAGGQGQCAFELVQRTETMTVHRRNQRDACGHLERDAPHVDRNGVGELGQLLERSFPTHDGDARDRSRTTIAQRGARKI